MTPRFSTALLLCLLCIFVVSVQGARWRKQRCRRPTIENGNVRIKSRGRVARYRCQRGYQIYGPRFNTCVRRRWLDPHSICVRAGCSDLTEFDNGILNTVIRDRVVSYSCYPGFLLRGHAVRYCNGRHWNGTQPACQAESVDPDAAAAPNCTFEQSLCGWTHDESAEFQWSWHSGSTPSIDMFTGPSSDHTFGVGSSNGHYMFIEASDPRVENDTARLFSPVYSQELSDAACFSMWFHHWGGSIGSLRIYILPVTESLDDQEGPAWEVTDSQGDRWIQALVSVPPQSSDFQVVVEGVRGVSYMSDSAVDDVALLHGDDCVSPTSSPQVPSTTLATTECRGRCDTAAGPGVCGCTHECLLDNNCCSDYSSACLEEDTSADGETTVTVPSIPDATSGTITDEEASSTVAWPVAGSGIGTSTSAPDTTAGRTVTEGIVTSAVPITTSSTASTTTTSTTTTTTTISTTTTTTTSATTTTTATRATTSTTTSTTTTTTTTVPPPTASSAAARTPSTAQSTAARITTPQPSAPPTTSTAQPTPRTSRPTAQSSEAASEAPDATQPPARTTQSSTTTASTTATQQPASSSMAPTTTFSLPSPTTDQPTVISSTVSEPSVVPTTTDMSNELPAPSVEGSENSLPQASRSSGSNPTSAGFPLYAVVGIAVGGLLVVVTVVAVLARHRCRGGGRRGKAGPLTGDDDDSLVFFSEPESAEPTLDLRLRTRPESVPSRPAPRRKTAKERKDSAEIEEFGIDAFEDQSETARLTQ